MWSFPFFLSVALVLGFISPGPVSAAETAEATIGLYVLGAFPSNQGLSAQGISPSDTRISNGVGAGIKVAVFPRYFQDIIGIELESFGHGSEVTFSSTSAASGGSPAGTNLWVFNSMVNLIARYPSNTFIPYIGVGAGLSDGVLTSANIPGRTDTDFEGSWTFGYQFLGGVQGNLTEKLFLFTEYKYFSANYHWKQLALDFRSQYALFGIGLRF
ncbi:MAG TPA: outer membrane beta-barrel protein [Nitrospiraceae bacterium]|nr:outer membrane beta-barrel protein [Nitrospiraceae bacterium]